MTTDFRALCAELLMALENAISIIYCEDGTKHISTAKPIVNRARAALADEPAAPVPPADGEVAELVAWLQEEADDYECIGCEDSAARCNRAAELLERQATACAICERERLHQSTRAADMEVERQAAPVPVPVNEQLPGPEDMTDDGEVWIEDPGCEYPLADAGDYDWEPHKWILRPIGKFDAQNGLRWLPAHALPLPEVGE